MTTGRDMTPDPKERERRRMAILMTLITVGIIVIAYFVVKSWMHL